MKKIILLTAFSFIFSGLIFAQPVGGNGNNQSQQDNDDVYRQNNNPYSDPNYYPNQGGNYGNNYPNQGGNYRNNYPNNYGQHNGGGCNNRPVVIVPPSYCAPVYINPYYRPLRFNLGLGYGPFRGGYARGYSRRGHGHHGRGRW